MHRSTSDYMAPTVLRFLHGTGQGVDHVALSTPRSRQTIWLPPYIGLCPVTLTKWLRPCVGRRQTIWLPQYFGLYPVTSLVIL
ncbi:hypothetical protein DPMN_058339 [Dreissena polymorpha]|uniref:Uncharacterized protein n=1 Tax=Dreissena polymorpha TaxID=45954 RepID=A0A9D4C1X4_DREPO|nr:hypothetical protein DPMN_058339 [Dreissena polymorpha]